MLPAPSDPSCISPSACSTLSACSGAWSGVPKQQRLLQQVADHPLALGAEHVERIGVDRRVGLALEQQQPDLRAVAVRDRDGVPVQQRRERACGLGEVAALDRGADRLAAGRRRGRRAAPGRS
jgi:hypothetical protein